MLSDKLELNSVRALGRLELTSWEHIPGWAEIQPPLGKTCESMAGLWWRQGCCQHRWPLQLWGLEPEVSGRLVCLDRMRGKKGLLAKPLLTRIPSPGGTVWSRALKFKSVKWAKPFHLDSQSFAFLQSYPGKARKDASCHAIIAWPGG